VSAKGAKIAAFRLKGKRVSLSTKLLTIITARAILAPNQRFRWHLMISKN
jgi:hypothetical protein